MRNNFLSRTVVRLAAALLLGALALNPTLAQQSAIEEGMDYTTLKIPQAVDVAGKVEVIEFFWYRCLHCHALEPAIEPWSKKLPRETNFRRVPAVFSDEWALDARVFYALEATGDWARLHGKLFDAIHKEGGVNQRGAAYIAWVNQWLGKNGVDVPKFEAALRSFSVESRVKRAAQMSQAYALDGVPAFAVQGKFLISSSQTVTRQRMLDVTSALVEQQRRLLK